MSAWILPNLGTIRSFGAVPDCHSTVSAPLIPGSAVSHGTAGRNKVGTMIRDVDYTDQYDC